jgi:uncharacterized protein (DUF2236 family)
MTATSPTSTRAPGYETPVADRPLVRELAEWRTLLPFAGRVLALQGSHPTIAAGLYDHSTGFTDPIGRAAGTLEYLQRILFGTDRADTAAEIRELHRDIKGTGFDDKPYHAWNREAWTWVHLTSFEAMLYSLRTIHGSLPAEQVEALYTEWKAVGLLYGVRSQDMPTGVPGLHRYIRDGIETKLTHAPDRALFDNLLKPPGSPIPAVAWKPLWRIGSQPVMALLFGSFPSTIRDRWGVRWSVLHEAEYRVQLTALRTAPRLLPDRLRMLPYAYRALHGSALAPG